MFETVSQVIYGGIVAYQPHTYITLGGRNSETSGNEDEIWQIGVRGFDTVSGNAPIDESQLLAAITAMRTDLVTWFTSNNAYHASAAYLDWIKAANINAAGDYSGEPAIIEGIAAAGADSDSAPSFLSVCYSWTTGRSFGKAKYGRVYPPNWGTPRAGGAQISALARGNLATAAQAFLAALDKSGSEWKFVPYVVSSSGVSNKITGVRVGSIWDVQRRRKNAVPETYSSLPYP